MYKIGFLSAYAEKSVRLSNSAVLPGFKAKLMWVATAAKREWNVRHRQIIYSLTYWLLLLFLVVSARKCCEREPEAHYNYKSLLNLLFRSTRRQSNLASSNLKHKSHDLIFSIISFHIFYRSSLSLCFRKCHRFIYRAAGEKQSFHVLWTLVIIRIGITL